MEGQDLSPPQVDASRPSLGFPLGTALLLIIIFTLSGVFSCCYHWDKFRSFRIEEAKQGRKLAGVDARGRASQVHCDALPLPADAASQGPRRQHRHCEGGEATAAASHPFIFVS
ncbi:hypothetical protein S245_010312 [Arachis hypogaea]